MGTRSRWLNANNFLFCVDLVDDDDDDVVVVVAVAVDAAVDLVQMDR